MATDFKELCKRPGQLRSAVQKILSKEFIYFDSFADVISSALLRPCHLLLVGPGGYGKSEMTKAVFQGLDLPLYVQGFSPETTYAQILGGLDAVKLLSTGAQEYRFASSFGAYPHAMFEEVLDASPNALTGLKDLLTDRNLRNGEQQCDLVTRTLIGATNRNVREFAEGDDSLTALLSRFDLMETIRWPEHSADDYARLFKLKTALPQFAGQLNGESEGSRLSLIEVLSNVLAELSEPGREVSPRVAVQCLEQVLLGRRLYGHNLIWRSDFDALKRVQDLQLRSDRAIIGASVEKWAKLKGYVFFYREVEAMINRLKRKFPNPQMTEDQTATFMADSTAIAGLLDLMSDCFRAHLKDIESLRSELSNTGGRK